MRYLIKIELNILKSAGNRVINNLLSSKTEHFAESVNFAQTSFYVTYPK